jgi:hypothetical protein
MAGTANSRELELFIVEVSNLDYTNTRSPTTTVSVEHLTTSARCTVLHRTSIASALLVKGRLREIPKQYHKGQWTGFEGNLW